MLACQVPSAGQLIQLPMLRNQNAPFKVLLDHLRSSSDSLPSCDSSPGRLFSLSFCIHKVKSLTVQHAGTRQWLEPWENRFFETGWNPSNEESEKASRSNSANNLWAKVYEATHWDKPDTKTLHRRRIHSAHSKVQTSSSSLQFLQSWTPWLQSLPTDCICHHLSHGHLVHAVQDDQDG